MGEEEAAAVSSATGTMLSRIVSTNPQSLEDGQMGGSEREWSSNVDARDWREVHVLPRSEPRSVRQLSAD